MNGGQQIGSVIELAVGSCPVGIKGAQPGGVLVCPFAARFSCSKAKAIRQENGMICNVFGGSEVLGKQGG